MSPLPHPGGVTPTHHPPQPYRAFCVTTRALCANAVPFVGTVTRDPAKDELANDRELACEAASGRPRKPANDDLQPAAGGTLR